MFMEIFFFKDDFILNLDDPELLVVVELHGPGGRAQVVDVRATAGRVQGREGQLMFMYLLSLSAK